MVKEAQVSVCFSGLRTRAKRDALFPGLYVDSRMLLSQRQSVIQGAHFAPVSWGSRAAIIVPAYPKALD